MHNTWQFGQLFCRSGETKVLGEGHLANASVWIFLLSHCRDCPQAQQGGVPPLQGLAAIFGMPIWHPTNKGKVDALLAAQIDVFILQL
jgi:hypothetical protein